MAKRSFKTRKASPPRWQRLWPLAAGIIAASLLLSIWLLHRLGSPKAGPLPAYEERRTNGFAAKVGEVEVLLYQGLHRLQITPAQISFNTVLPKGDREHQWIYAELEVNLSRNQDPEIVAATISKTLQAANHFSHFRVEKSGPNSLAMAILVDDVLTHRLFFHRATRPQVEPLRSKRPQVAIVVDDFGYDGRLAKRFLALDLPLSFSVLPHATFSQSIASRIHRAGRDLLLHLPMEPKEYPEVDPGKGALFAGMSPETITRTLAEDLAAVPHAQGVNNHMGSRFTESAEGMRVLLRELKKRNLFYLDSRTSGKSKGYGIARQLGLPAGTRDVFLDNVQEPASIRTQISHLMQIARLKGKAIGIAHPYTATLEVLAHDLPLLAQQGVDLVPVSRLLSPDPTGVP